MVRRGLFACYTLLFELRQHLNLAKYTPCFMRPRRRLAKLRRLRPYPQVQSETSSPALRPDTSQRLTLGLISLFSDSQRWAAKNPFKAVALSSHDIWVVVDSQVESYHDLTSFFSVIDRVFLNDRKKLSQFVHNACFSHSKMF